MIYIVVTEANANVARNLQSCFREHLEVLLYEEIYYYRKAPVGHYIFTDFDRLTHHAIAYVAELANAVSQAAGDVRILNHPLRAKERIPLLAALHAAGINDFQALRIDTGARPSRYPVFLRAEDGAKGSETELLHDDEQFDRAVSGLMSRGIPLKGRIAVEFSAQPDANGLYRKYGAIRVDDSIIPQHMLYSDSWMVKGISNIPAFEETMAAQELEFVRDNPHAEELMKAFQLAGIEYGRLDYGLVNGRVQVYEINTNPRFPSFHISDGLRAARRSIISERLAAAFESLDTPVASTGLASVAIPAPRSRIFQVPRSEIRVSAVPRRLWRSMRRRLGRLLRR